MTFKIKPLALSLLLFLLLSLLLCQGSAWAAEEEEMLTPAQFQAFNQASELFQAEKYAEILPLLKEMVEANSPHPYACVLYGLAQLRLNHPEEAIRIFRKGLAASPKYQALHLNLAVALLQLERYAPAANSFIQAAALESGENKSKYLYTAAQCYYLAENYTKSLSILQPLLKQGRVPQDWLQLALANCTQIPRWQEAEGYLRRLINHNPGQRQYWKGLAYARSRQGNDAGAAAALEVSTHLPGVTQSDYRDLSSLYRRSAAPLLSLSTEKHLPAGSEQDKIYLAALNRANRQEELQKYLEKMISAKPTAELCLLQGLSYYRQGKLDQAKSSLILGSKLGGAEAGRCQMLAGMIAWQEGDWSQARSLFEPLAENSGPQQPQALMALEALDSLEELAASLEEESESPS